MWIGTRCRQRGYTLLEILVASSATLIVLLAIYLTHDTSQATYARLESRMDIQQTARLAMEQVARDIRQAGHLTGTPPNTYPIIIATNDTLSIHADIEGTGNRYITYGLRDTNGNLTTTLLRQSSPDTAATPLFSGGEVLADNLVGLKFIYYTSENLPLPDPPNPPYQLDGQNYVTGTSQPALPVTTSDRAKLKQIKIELTLQRSVGGLPQIYTSTTDVTLRNVR